MRLIAQSINDAAFGDEHLLNVLPLNQAAAPVADRATLVRYFRLVFAVVAVTLLMACSNIANLLIVRARERSAEIGIRTALGATASRIALQLGIESAVLAVLGGVLGLMLAVGVLQVFASFTLPGRISLQSLDIRLNPRVLAFAFGITALSAVIFGATPSLQSFRGNVVDRLRRTDTSVRTLFSSRGGLLALQVSISFTLLVGCALFLSSLRNGLNTKLGFNPDPIAAVSIRPRFSGRRVDNAMLYLSVVDRAGRTPGIGLAAVTSHIPLEGSRALPFTLGAAGSTEASSVTPKMMPIAAISRDYFRVLGTVIVDGRMFDRTDGPTAPRVVIINQSAARDFWPGESALNKHISLINDLTYTVVGVVADTKYSTLQDNGVPFAYAPIEQEETRGNVTFIARSNQPAVALASLSRSIAETSPELSVVRPRLVKDQISAALMPQRFGAWLLSIFALLALLLSAVGIYGTVSYTVARRTKEIGIRMALGARGASVVVSVLSETLAAVGIGIAGGVLITMYCTRLISHFLYGIEVTDWLPFVISMAVLVLVAVVAAAWPAFKSSRIDPLTAIRLS